MNLVNINNYQGLRGRLKLWLAERPGRADRSSRCADCLTALANCKGLPRQLAACAELPQAASDATAPYQPLRPRSRPHPIVYPSALFHVDILYTPCRSNRPSLATAFSTPTLGSTEAVAGQSGGVPYAGLRATGRFPEKGCKQPPDEERSVRPNFHRSADVYVKTREHTGLLRGGGSK